MIVTISHHSNDDIIHEFEKDTISIGRSSSCDIKISSDNISRKHLEIKVEDDQILIKDISSSNWVSYDGKPLGKESYSKYFDFMELALPDEYVISVSRPISASDRTSITQIRTISRNHAKATGDDAGKTITVSRTNIIPPGKRPKRKSAGSAKTSKKPKQTSKEKVELLIAFIAIVIAGISVIFYLQGK